MSVTYSVVVVPSYGSPDVLAVQKRILREPLPGEVRVRLLAAGVSQADTHMREGTYIGGPKPPFVPGYDIVGVVDQIGTGVRMFRIGDRVCSLTIYGGFSEYLFLPESELYGVPDEVESGEAVSLILNYMTAYQMLHRSAKAKEGETLLIHGASGGVGTALLQLGRDAGLNMVGTSSPDKFATLHQYGCKAVDYRSADWEREIEAAAPKGYDMILEGTGGPVLRRSVKRLSPKGRLVAYGVTHMLKGGRRQGRYVTATYYNILSSMIRCRLRGRTGLIHSITAMKKKHPDWFREDLEVLFALLVQRRIEPIVARRMKLDQAADALRLLENRKVTGKIVLVP